MAYIADKRSIETMMSHHNGTYTDYDITMKDQRQTVHIKKQMFEN